MNLQEISKEVVYCPETGDIKTTRRRGNLNAGQSMGCHRKDGYIELQILGKRIGAHRLAFALSYGYFPQTIDHINGIRSDNRLANLRAATVTQNNRNARKKSSSRFKGVASKQGKFEAAIRNGGALIYLGRFSSDTAAAYAYDTAALTLHGEFARCNFLPMVK